MGVDNTSARMLLLLRNEASVNLKNSVILGRQHNYVGPFLRRSIQKNFGLAKDSLPLNSQYADEFLSILGMENPAILDNSDYEGATILHDLNTEIPNELKNQFSTVIDLGTLEHVYNIPQALRNLQEMCSPGGFLMMVSPANSWLGHGFYQFSPEFFFRAFGEHSGFEIRRVILIRHRLLKDVWCELIDPKKTGRRGTIYTKNRCTLAMIATKLSDSPDTTLPQQSDYQSAWEMPIVSKLGQIYLNLPWIFQKLVANTVIRLLDRFRNRLSRVRLKWSKGSLIISE